MGSKRDDSKASLPVSVDESPNKRLRTAEKGSGDPKSSPAKSVVKSKFFADSPTKAVAARKRKEQEEETEEVNHPLSVLQEVASGGSLARGRQLYALEVVQEEETETAAI